MSANDLLCNTRDTVASWDYAIGCLLPYVLLDRKGTPECVNLLSFHSVLYWFYIVKADSKVLSVGDVTYRMEYRL